MWHQFFFFTDIWSVLLLACQQHEVLFKSMSAQLTRHYSMKNMDFKFTLNQGCTLQGHVGRTRAIKDKLTKKYIFTKICQRIIYPTIWLTCSLANQTCSDTYTSHCTCTFTTLRPHSAMNGKPPGPWWKTTPTHRSIYWGSGWAACLLDQKQNVIMYYHQITLTHMTMLSLQKYVCTLTV